MRPSALHHHSKVETIMKVFIYSAISAFIAIQLYKFIENRRK